MADKYDDLYSVVPVPLTNPWGAKSGAAPGDYQPDYTLLSALIDVTVQNGKAFDPQSGGLAAATNVWVATELRRAGVEADRVWPRTSQPRTLPWDAAAVPSTIKLRKDPRALQLPWGVSQQLSKDDLRIVQEQTVKAVLAEIGKGIGLPLGPTGRRKNPANILGVHFPKEIDVAMARYDRGLELGVSTKTMIDSPLKNLPNRREEASGDLLNIRRRFPLSVLGYFFLLHYDIASNKNYFDRIIDMCRKISLEAPGHETFAYDASCLVVAEIHQNPAKTVLHPHMSPPDLAADQFFTKIMDRLLTRSQSDDHLNARDSWSAAGYGP